MSIICPKILILVQDLSRVFFLVQSFFILDKNLSKVCPSFVNQILRTSDRIACPIFVKILSMSKFGLFYYICLFRIQNILLEICMNMSSLTVTLYGWPKLVISVITVIIVISIIAVKDHDLDLTMRSMEPMILIFRVI